MTCLNVADDVSIECPVISTYAAHKRIVQYFASGGGNKDGKCRQAGQSGGRGLLPGVILGRLGEMYPSWTGR